MGNTIQAGALAALLLICVEGHAATLAGTPISNVATVTYTLDGAAASPIASAPATFVVDNKVNLTVAETGGAATPAATGQSAAVAAFTVTNQGNAVQDYALAVSNIAGGAALFDGIDTFDATGCIARVESGAVAGFDPTDIDSFIDELPPDASRTVHVVCDLPAGLASGDLALVSLTATTLAGGTPGAQGAAVVQGIEVDDPAAVQVVFADAAGSDDAARDGNHSARDAYRVGALLTLAKRVIHVQDPFGCSAASGCRIVPGAILTYRIDVVASGSGTLDDLVLSDPIPANMRYVPGSLVVDGTPRTDAADADLADFGISQPDTVTVSPGSVSAPLTSWFSFRALIN